MNLLNLSVFAIFTAHIFLVPVESAAEELGPVAIYYRCYKHIVNHWPKYDRSFNDRLKSGAIDPIVECRNILDTATLRNSTATTVADLSNITATRVLHNFHMLHNSWFKTKTVDTSMGRRSAAIVNAYDLTSPAAYFTYALLSRNYAFRNVVTGANSVQPVRLEEGQNTVRRPSELGDTFPSGLLVGAQPVTQRLVEGFDIDRSRGGGILGMPSYLQFNLQGNFDFQADGGEQVPRKWSVAIFNDLFCRKMPVVRESDAAPFVVASSPIEFRQSSSCVKCHATMDRMAGVIRGIHWRSLNSRFNAVDFHSVSSPSIQGWPASPDANYKFRPATGVLFYRSFSGQLINLPVSSLPDLGEKMAAQDDIYVCAAKRYFKHFTGLDVDITDLADPASTKVLTEKDHEMRNLVVTLGQNLKEHQSLKQLASDIMNLDIYKLSDYGVKE